MISIYKNNITGEIENSDKIDKLEYRLTGNQLGLILTNTILIFSTGDRRTYICLKFFGIIITQGGFKCDIVSPTTTIIFYCPEHFDIAKFCILYGNVA